MRSRRNNGGSWIFVALLLASGGFLFWLFRGQTPPDHSPVRETNTPHSKVTVEYLKPAITNAPPGPPPQTKPVTSQPSASAILEAQIALARQAISPGSIDGVLGSQTRSALRAFQKKRGLSITGDLDADTRQALTLSYPASTSYVVTPEDLARLLPLPQTWLEKSEQSKLDYETILELVSEKGEAHPALIRQLNPQIVWTNVTPGTIITIPNATPAPPLVKAAFVRIEIESKTLEAFDTASNLLAHFPCSIAKRVEKRPIGKLFVAKVALNPTYLFDPGVFPESEEAQSIGRKLMVPAGPNNPVGTAWIGLDKPGYGIHGTPKPEQVGRTESHGCFRLANWNAEYLVKLVWVGMPILVEP